MFPIPACGRTPGSSGRLLWIFRINMERSSLNFSTILKLGKFRGLKKHPEVETIRAYRFVSVSTTKISEARDPRWSGPVSGPRRVCRCRPSWQVLPSRRSLCSSGEGMGGGGSIRGGASASGQPAAGRRPRRLGCCGSPQGRVLLSARGGGPGRNVPAPWPDRPSRSESLRGKRRRGLAPACDSVPPAPEKVPSALPAQMPRPGNPGPRRRPGRPGYMRATQARLAREWGEGGSPVCRRNFSCCRLGRRLGLGRQGDSLFRMQAGDPDCHGPPGPSRCRRPFCRQGRLRMEEPELRVGAMAAPVTASSDGGGSARRCVAALPASGEDAWAEHRSSSPRGSAAAAAAAWRRQRAARRGCCACCSEQPRPKRSVLRRPAAWRRLVSTSGDGPRCGELVEVARSKTTVIVCAVIILSFKQTVSLINVQIQGIAKKSSNAWNHR